MRLNDTLDRLAKEREERDIKATIRSNELHPLVKDLAEKIFFDRMLKDINHGMGKPKIEVMIDRSIMIAQMLADELHGF